MPWLGFFHKISVADVYVVLDTVQFRKSYFQNRNQIRTAYGKSWLTVPVKNKMALIKDVEISYEHKWVRRYLNLINENYAKSSFYRRYAHKLLSIVKNEHKYLHELNIEIIMFLLESLNIPTKVIRSSELQLPHCKDATGVNLNICRAVGATTYISGISGREYLNAEQFQRNNIEVVFQEFHHPIYKQLHEPFIPCVSVMDLLFNHGPNSLNIIKGIGVPVMDEVFS